MSRAALVRCDGCDFQLTGFRCLGTRNPEQQVEYEPDGWSYKKTLKSAIPVPVSGCGELLQPVGGSYKSNYVILACPKEPSHGRVAFECTRKCEGTKLVVLEDHETEELTEQVNKVLNGLPMLGDVSPALTCTKCGFTVDGVLCASEDHRLQPLPLPQNGFFERVWCSYVFSCERGCGREKSGGLYHQTTCVNCEQSTSLLDFVERNGPPMN